MKQSSADVKAYAISGDALEFGPTHSAKCEMCGFDEERSTRAAVKRVAAAHVEETGHQLVVIFSRHYERLMACPLIPKYETHPRRVKR
jgi:hypothetical protein